MTRKEIADLLKKASVGYFAHRGFSCHIEVGLVKRGRLRADVLAFNTKLEICVAECKSCWEDFRLDSKWEGYLSRANRLFFVFTEHTFETRKDDILKKIGSSGAGILVLSSKTGLLESRKNSKSMDLQGSIRRELITRIAYRNGLHRGNSRRIRLYVAND